MTPTEARRRVAEIKAVAGDDEVAHSQEDKLRADVLRHIEAHSSDSWARELCKIALSTSDIDFARWCA